MSKFNEEWKVGPHSSLQELNKGLFTVAAEIAMPLGNFPRRMTVVELRGNRSAIWSAVPLREPDMKKIEELGEPSFLIVSGKGTGSISSLGSSATRKPWSCARQAPARPWKRLSRWIPRPIY